MICRTILRAASGIQAHEGDCFVPYNDIPSTVFVFNNLYIRCHSPFFFFGPEKVVTRNDDMQ
ncbi:MAG: hypothetical protein JWQ09_1637 [Segetibacter sp.]|nr:hypothetical protein [Segetibacter sp.]